MSIKITGAFDSASNIFTLLNNDGTMRLRLKGKDSNFVILQSPTGSTSI